METASGCTKQRLQETEAVMNESRLRSANAKIIIWEHVIEGTEVLLRRTHQLLYRLSSRCDNAATDMEEIETGGQVPEVLAAQELLYELDSTLKFVCDVRTRRAPRKVQKRGARQVVFA